MRRQPPPAPVGSRVDSHRAAAPGAPENPRLPRALFPWTLTQGSDLFLTPTHRNLSLPHTVLLYALLHVIRALAAVPGGKLSDRLGRKPVLLLGWATYGLIYLGMGLLPAFAPIWFLLYGLYAGLVEGGERALVAELAPAAQRGAAFGWFYGLTGFFILPANLVLGYYWSPATAPLCLSVVGALAVLCTLLLTLLPLPRRH